MTYSPNLPIGTGWKSTLQVAFQTLRRVKFIIDDDFKWTDYVPIVNFGGMTTSGYDATSVKYLQRNKVLFVSINISATLAAPFTNVITVSVPEQFIFGSIASQRGATCDANAGAIELGLWEATRNTNTISFYRAGLANYTAGLMNIKLNTFLEIE